VELAPDEYGLLVEAARSYGREERWAEAEPLLVHAIQLSPIRSLAWRMLSEQRLLQGRGREGHAVALEGLALVGPDADLWELVSESYVLKGDYDAAVRARWASFGVADGSSRDWRRMSELLGLTGDSEEAMASSQRADLLANQEISADGAAPPIPGPQR
jgi:tetratricopeptide (TPR) repeat protein